MLTQVHHTHEELILLATQSLAADQVTSIQEHVQTCAACRAQLADVCFELALLGEPVQQREVPLGARQRFLERVAAVAPIEPKGTTAKVESIATGSERHRTSRHIRPAIQKKSLLLMNAPAASNAQKKAQASKVKTAVIAASEAMAARIAHIF